MCPSAVRPSKKTKIYPSTPHKQTKLRRQFLCCLLCELCCSVADITSYFDSLISNNASILICENFVLTILALVLTCVIQSRINSTSSLRSVLLSNILSALTICRRRSSFSGNGWSLTCDTELSCLIKLWQSTRHTKLCSCTLDIK